MLRSWRVKLTVLFAGVLLILGISLFAGANKTETPIVNRPVSPPDTSISKNFITGEYVALGDSVAAGAGLPSSAQASLSDTQCGRSDQAYPAQVATSLQLEYRNLACGGATTANVIGQLDSAFINGTPGLITITVGANDVEWVDFIRECFEAQCDTPVNTAVAESYLTQMRTGLNAVLAGIQSRSNSTPPIVIVSGYYNPASSTCNLIPQVRDYVTDSEIEWFEGQTVALNQTIRDAASSYSFVRFAEVTFDGHDLCSGNAWIQGPGDNAPFHPNDDGQAAIATAVSKAAKAKRR